MLGISTESKYKGEPNMAFKSPNDLANSFTGKKFAYANKLEDINNVLNKFSDDEIDLEDGYYLYPNKRKVYGDERDYNVEFDVSNGNDIIDTLGVYGLDFDEDYQRQLEEIINNHRGGRR